jgi:hypothetical protein
MNVNKTTDQIRKNLSLPVVVIVTLLTFLSIKYVSPQSQLGLEVVFNQHQV